MLTWQRIMKIQQTNLQTVPTVQTVQNLKAQTVPIVQTAPTMQNPKPATALKTEVPMQLTAPVIVTRAFCTN